MTNTTSQQIKAQTEKPKNKSLFSNYLGNSEEARHRIEIFEKILARQKQELSALTGEISISLVNSDGSLIKISGRKGETTPFSAAKQGEHPLTEKAVISKVNGDLFDLHRPLETDSKIELLEFGSKEGQMVFWHSSAHALGECLEILFDGKLTIGPPLETCFYYDADLGEKHIAQSDYPLIEKTLKKVVSDKQKFERVVLTKPEALEMFKMNKYKQQLIKENIPDDAVCTAYRCGPLIDLCRGPHIPSTGLIKAFKILKHSACYWKGDSSNAQMQRVYGLSYPDKKQLKARLGEIALSKERDHRKTGRDQNLFFFHPLSPGSAFWLPNGTKIYNKLLSFLRNEYRRRGYKEVISPNIYNMDLWKTSGHATKYKENMFCFELEKQEFAMKPMNCPGHCLMFKHQKVSYRELPIRLADFGVLHRNELTGALSGLTRVRRFQQDDAHIFCSVDSIGAEVQKCLEFMRDVYAIFGFKFSLALSTRPEQYIGSINVWDKAEKALEISLNNFGCEWTFNKGDGAFYGPKIDILLKDALGRSIQCATIQLDFNLPSKDCFDLTFSNNKGEYERPVIVHRAILGSIERFVSILAEHCGGKWPFWISPRQIMVVPVSEKHLDFAEKVRQDLHQIGFEADCDRTNNKMQKKVRTAQVSQYNVILVVGEKEIETNVFTVRYRNRKDFDQMTFDELVSMLSCWVKEKK